MPWRKDRKLREIELRSLLQVGYSIFDGFTLRSGTGLRIQSNVTAFFGGSKYRGQFHGLTPQGKAQLSLIPGSGTRLYSSTAMLDELANVLKRPSASKRLAMIGTSARQLLADYLEVLNLVEPTNVPRVVAGDGWNPALQTIVVRL